MMIFLRSLIESASFHLVLVTHTETQEADDDIARFDDHRIAGNTYTVTRSCLTCDSQIATSNIQLAGQIDRTGYVEDNRTCAIHLHGLTQRTLDRLSGGFIAFVGEGCDMHYHAAAASRSVSSATIRARESEHGRWLRSWLLRSHTPNEAEESEEQDICAINTHSHSKAYHSMQRYSHRR